MQRLRRAVIRCARLANPALGLACIVVIGGLGLHAARDWHRHGELGAGFFHLHFHVGNHDHHHQDHSDDNHDTPTDGNQRRTAVLTVAQAFDHLASITPAIVCPGSDRDRMPIRHLKPARPAERSALAKPRAPPA